MVTSLDWRSPSRSRSAGFFSNSESLWCLGTATGFLLGALRFPGRDLLDSPLTCQWCLPAHLSWLITSGAAWAAQHVFGALALHDSFGQSIFIFTWQGAVIAAPSSAFPLVFSNRRGRHLKGSTSTEKMPPAAGTFQSWQNLPFG